MMLLDFCIAAGKTKNANNFSIKTVDLQACNRKTVVSTKHAAEWF